MPGTFEKTLTAILSGASDNNIKFRDLQNMLDNLGFKYRIKGDHFIYYKQGISEIINIQPAGNMAKPYQVKQVRQLIIKYRLMGA